MTIAGFIVRNALRNKRRLLLTVLSVALSLFLFTTLQTALRELTQPPSTEASALRIIVRHRVSLANLIPARYVEQVRRMPGVQHASRFTWFGGIYKEAKNFFPNFACDPGVIFKIFNEAVIDPRQADAFIKEKNACVVGIKTLERFGWRVGDRITLLGEIFPCDVELVIRGVYREGIDETNLFFQHAYLDELMDDFGEVGTIWIRAAKAEQIPELIQRIDRTFKNSDAETKTETERAFQLSFVSMFGNIKTLIGSICTVIVFTMMLVTASTMSMSIRERAREIAILKTLGYDRLRLYGLILAESFGLALLGGLLGCGGAWALYGHIDVYKATHGFFIKFDVTPYILAAGLLIAAALGVVSSLAPAWSTLRTTIVGGLRELD
jgi:putative ABC transport system permease protein